MNKMTERLEKLAEYGKSILKVELNEHLSDINKSLNELRNNKNDERVKRKLSINIKYYDLKVNEFQNNYGVKFSDLEDYYKELISEVNKYLQTEEIKIN